MPAAGAWWQLDAAAKQARLAQTSDSNCDAHHRFLNLAQMLLGLHRTPWFDRVAAMDKHPARRLTDSTQRLLAERLRQRYARCREILASHDRSMPVATESADSTRASADAAPRSTQAQPAPLPSTSSPERFTTLFTHAYTAARDSQDNALAVILDRGRRHLAA